LQPLRDVETVTSERATNELLTAGLFPAGWA
jgi:hypothetical protein